MLRSGSIINSSVAENSDVEISDGVKKYLETLLSSHVDTVIARFEKNEAILTQRIDALESRIAEKDDIINGLTIQNEEFNDRFNKIESQIAVVKSVNESLIIQQDDLEQYGRRTNIRIEGIQYTNGETLSDLKTKITQCLAAANV